MGYQLVVVSGGEPFLYGPLSRLLRHARGLGLRTAVVTNGTCLGDGRFDEAGPWLDALAVSCDGPPAMHDDLRGAGAFAALVSGLEAVRRSGLPFGLIHTVTRRSWEHLPWLGRFAVDQHASLLQLHPLESAGRARTGLRGDRVDDGLLARTWIMGRAIAATHQGRLRVHVDAVTRSTLLHRPDEVLAGPESDHGAPPDAAEAARYVPSLVIEPDGAAIPLSYGLSRAFRVGSLDASPLAAAWPDFTATRLPALRALCRSLRDACLESGAEVVGWHDLLVARSHSGGACDVLATAHLRIHGTDVPFTGR